MLWHDVDEIKILFLSQEKKQWPVAIVFPLCVYVVIRLCQCTFTMACHSLAQYVLK